MAQNISFEIPDAILSLVSDVGGGPNFCSTRVRFHDPVVDDLDEAQSSDSQSWLSDLTSGLFVFGGGAAASSQSIFSDNIFGPIGSITPGPSPTLSQTPSLSPSPAPSDCPGVDAPRGDAYSSCGGKGVRFQDPAVDAPDDLPEIPPFPTCDGIEVLAERLANATCHCDKLDVIADMSVAQLTKAIDIAERRGFTDLHRTMDAQLQGKLLEDDDVGSWLSDESDDS